jgi:hypothetical protein
MTSPITTPRFPHHPENVPDELKVGEVWVTCDEWKAPLIPIPSGAVFAAKSTDPDTWRDYDTALKTFVENEHIAGIGRVLVEDEDYAGVDLDDCLDPDTGELTQWAATILRRLSSYAEISPSLSGIKIWVRAPKLKTSYKKPGLEIYPARRYFTVTGRVFGDQGPYDTIVDASDELATIIEEEFPKVDRDRTPYGGPERVLDLGELLERSDIEVFTELSDGSAERKYAVRCPWAEEHTGGDVSGTYCGQYENGALFFVCYHSHCSKRRWRQFRYNLESLIYLGRPPRTGGRLR